MLNGTEKKYYHIVMTQYGVKTLELDGVRQPMKSQRLWILITIVLSSALIAVIVAWGILSHGFQLHTKDLSVCNTPECTLAAASLLTNLDYSIDPCDDFHKFVCGRYDVNHEIPAGMSRYGTLAHLEAKVKRYLRSLLEEQIGPDDLPSAAMAKTYYRSCMGQNSQKKKYGLMPLYKTEEAIGPWPVLHANWTPPEGFSWEKQALLGMQVGGRSTIIDLSVGVDLRNTTQRVIQITQTFLPMRVEEYAAGWNSSRIYAYYQMLVNTAIVLGAEPAVATKDMYDVMELEMELANVSMPLSTQEFDDVYVMISIGELKKNIPSVDWDTLLSIFPPDVNLTNEDRVFVPHLLILPELASIVEKYSPRTLKNFLNKEIILKLIPFLPNEYQKAAEAFEHETSGIKSSPPLWKSCIQASRKLLGDIVSAMYVRKHFKATERHHVESMIGEVKSTLIELIATADWIDDETRDAALRKGHAISQKIGYSDLLYNESFLMEKYWDIKMSPDEFFENTEMLFRTELETDLASIRDPMDPDKWSMAPAHANAYYDRIKNEIAFPAGILQFPMFSDGVPAYFNFGKLGSIIGHEITHGYDDEGRQFDELGNVRDWWGNKTLPRYLKKAECFATQYNAIKDSVTGVQLNGNNTLAENVADAGGVKIAHKTFIRWLASQTDVPVLPGLQEFSPEQLFFLSYGNTWCELLNIRFRVFTIFEEDHTIGRYRINVPLQNLPEFADAFNCPKNSSMRPEKYCDFW